MTEEKFTELVNLYLDKEISGEELARLKRELAESKERQEEFADRVRLHQATRIACGCRSTPARRKSIEFPKWAMGSGLAASFLLAALILPQFDKSPRGRDIQSTPLTVTQVETTDPLANVGQSEYRRYASAQQASFNPDSSLVAHMRLLSLRPEYTPEVKELRTVDWSELEPKSLQANRAELLNEIQKLRAFPEVQVLRDDFSDLRDGDMNTTFGNGFKASLVRY